MADGSHGEIGIRPARANDIDVMLPMVDEASGGVWPLAWRRRARPGESDEAAGRRMLADPGNALSIANGLIAECDGRAVGMMIGWPETAPRSAEPPSPPHELDAVLAPFAALIDHDSWFVSELCVDPALRGAGLGSRFLAIARERARAHGRPRVSLKAFEENEGAVRLYRRTGFVVADRAAVVPHADLRFGGDVLLMAWSPED